jgi:predicted enzyme related to lactoylglutathione lyase
MTRTRLLAAAAAVLAGLAATASPTVARAEPAPVVFFDIAGPDLARQAAFYRTVFDWKIAADGRFSTPAQTPLGGFLRVEPPSMGPATERLVYMGVPDISATLKQVVANGGAVVFPRTPVPGVVVLGLFTDPAGNRMGLVEMKDGRAVVP